MKYKAAIFDMDGLLLDTESIFLEAFKNTCKRLDLDFDMSMFKSLIGTNSVKTKTILEEHFGEGFSHEVFRKTWRQYVAGYISEKSIPLKEGVPELLDKVRNQKLPMAVATSTAYKDACKTLERTGLIDYFDFIVAGDQVIKGKPDPEIYLKVAEKINVLPEECIAFEDSENGVKSALAAGMEVIQVPDLIYPSDELRSMGYRIIDSLKKVCDDFDSIFKSN